MAPPSVSQLDVINDLEAALKVLQSSAERITIGRLLEYADISAPTLSAIVNRLRLAKNAEYLHRLRLVFSQATKMPVCLAPDAGEKNVSLHCGPPDMFDVYPGDVRPKLMLTPTMPEAVVYPVLDERDTQAALISVLTILKPFSKSERDRIISSTSMFYGIGI